MAEPVLELEVARYVRGDVEILTDVRWCIQPGEHWALLGANGSGKSSLLNVVAGYEWPSLGSVSLLGERYGECYMPDLKKRVGLVSASLYERLKPRDTALSVATSGLHAIIGPYRIYTDAELERGRDALEQIRVGHLAERPYGVLSQGEKQRVVIARALVRDPDLLILDEPCSGLDPAAREAFLSDVAELCERANGPTLILVTHHVEEIPPVVSHVHVLRHGATLAAGPKAEVLTSDVLSRAFEASCELTESGGRYRLRVVSSVT